MSFQELIVASGHYLMSFVYFFPLVMAHVWVVGALFFRFRRECTEWPVDDPPALPESPGVTIIVPCHNEQDLIRGTISHLLSIDYPRFEIIAVNDGSTDHTGGILESMSIADPRLRVLHFATNQGKAMGLNRAAMMAKYEFLVCIDGDALLDHSALPWLIRHFLANPRVGGITGNPRIRNRSTLLGKIQVGEFSAVVGMIKRAQSTYGRLFAMSGVISAFRKSAVMQIGLWSVDMVTEDIDVCWRLQLGGWVVEYEPNALCWILMPETFIGLWRQRLRWAQGGAEVILRHCLRVVRWRHRRMWPVLVEAGLGFAWAFAVPATFCLYALGLCLGSQGELAAPALLPQLPGALLGLTCMLQFLVSFFLELRYEKRIGPYFFWIIWYPFAFWLIGLVTSLAAVPRAIFKERGLRAVWISPDRGPT